MIEIRGDKGQQEPSIVRKYKPKPGVKKHKSYDKTDIQMPIDAIKARKKHSEKQKNTIFPPSQKIHEICIHFALISFFL